MKLKRFAIMIIAAGCILVYPAQAAPPISATSAESSHLNASQRDTFTANNTGILCRVFEAKTA
jgi:hypothetical protein